MMIHELKEVKDAAKQLRRRKEELEREMEHILKKFERKEVEEKEFLEKKHKIEREYVEVMDRLAQLKYILGEA